MPATMRLMTPCVLPAPPPAAIALPAPAATAAPTKGITMAAADGEFVTNELAINGADTITAPSKRCITEKSIMMFAARNIGSASDTAIKVSVEVVNNMANIAIIRPCTIGHTSAKAQR